MIVVIESSFIFLHDVRISTDLQIQALWYATDRVAALPVQIWQELDTALQHNNKSIPTFKCSGIFKERKKLLLFLSRLQSYEQTIIEKSPPLFIFPLPVFLYFFLIFLSHFFLICPIQMVVGLSFGRFSAIFCLFSYYKETSSRLNSPNSCFFVYITNFPLSFLIPFLILSIHLILGLPFGRFPSILVCSILLGIFSSLVCITW